MPDYREDFEHYDSLWTHVHENIDMSGKKYVEKVSSSAWRAAGKGYNGVSLKGSLRFNDARTGSLLKFSLEPFREEPSCRFQRAFGAGGFLYVDAPTLYRLNLPSHIRGNAGRLSERCIERLLGKKRFPNRSWTAYLIKPKSSKKSTAGSHLEVTDSGGQRIVFFAEEIFSPQSSPTLRVKDLFGWFLPVEKPRGLP